AGVGEVLGKLDVLAGRRLVYLSDLRRQASGRWLAERYELHGEGPRRPPSLDLPEGGAPRALLPARLYLQAGGGGARARGAPPLAPARGVGARAGGGPARDRPPREAQGGGPELHERPGGGEARPGARAAGAAGARAGGGGGGPGRGGGRPVGARGARRGAPAG